MVAGRLRRLLGELPSPLLERPAELRGHEVCIDCRLVVDGVLMTCYSLAWCELYLIFASVFRRVDLQLYDSRYVRTVSLAATTKIVASPSPEDMKFKAHFVATFQGNPVRAFVKPMTT